MNERKLFIKAFKEVKSIGFMQTNRTGNTGIGKTLEDCMNVKENNIDAPDLHGFEIKSQRALSASYVTLFTKAPTFPLKANTYLRVKYGTPDRKAPEMKVLHTSMFSQHFNNHKSGYGFRIDRDDTNRKLRLAVINYATSEHENENIYWSYDVLENIINHKLTNLAFVQADIEKRDGAEFFNFKRCTLFNGASFDKFLIMLSENKIQFDIRIGVFRKGNSAGKSHDHGSGFRVKKQNIAELFDFVEEF